MRNVHAALLLAGRILLVAIFLIAGIDKIGNYANTQAYMAANGVPGALLPAVIALEIGAALAVILGWFTRPGALALAVFSALAALLFHFAPDDQIQMILFMKNWSMAGGLLVLAAAGPGPWSIDARRGAA